MIRTGEDILRWCCAVIVFSRMIPTPVPLKLPTPVTPKDARVPSSRSLIVAEISGEEEKGYDVALLKTANRDE